MERGATMLLHAIIIGVILYFTMVYVLGQDKSIAENRSILLSCCILIYMILFGHGLPFKLNKNL